MVTCFCEPQVSFVRLIQTPNLNQSPLGCGGSRNDKLRHCIIQRFIQRFIIYSSWKITTTFIIWIMHVSVIKTIWSFLDKPVVDWFLLKVKWLVFHVNEKFWAYLQRSPDSFKWFLNWPFCSLWGWSSSGIKLFFLHFRIQYVSSWMFASHLHLTLSHSVRWQSEKDDMNRDICAFLPDCSAFIWLDSSPVSPCSAGKATHESLWKTGLAVNLLSTSAQSW